MVEEDAEASSKRWLWIGAALVLIAGVVVVVVVSGGDDSAPIPASTEEAFQDAEVRFHEQSDEAMTREHTFDVPAGTSVMTMARSFSFSEDGRYRLLDPDGDQVGSINPSNTGGFELPTSRVVVHRPDPGTWRVELECEAACSYTVGVYFGDAVSAPGASLEPEVAGHEIIRSVDHSGSISSQETFEVPEGTQAIDLSLSVYAPDGMGFAVLDPSGEDVTQWGWGAEWDARKAAYSLTESTAPGTWTIEYECAAGCQVAWGFTPVQAPG